MSVLIILIFQVSRLKKNSTSFSTQLRQISKFLSSSDLEFQISRLWVQTTDLNSQNLSHLGCFSYESTSNSGVSGPGFDCEDETF